MAGSPLTWARAYMRLHYGLKLSAHRRISDRQWL